MQIVKIYNPYFDKEYKVVESKGDIEQILVNIIRGNENFLHLHDYETGNSITISPKNCASMEVCDAPTITEADKTEWGEWVDDKCSACGKGIEDLIYSYEWYRNEEPKFCPFCGIPIKSEE